MPITIDQLIAESKRPKGKKRVLVRSAPRPVHDKRKPQQKKITLPNVTPYERIHLPAGTKKVTIALPWCASKFYLMRPFFQHIANLDLPQNHEIYITVDHAYTERKSFSIQENTRWERRARVAKAHELLRKRAVANKSDYLMIVETDILIPPDSFLRMKHIIEGYDKVGAVGLPYTWHGINIRYPIMAWTGNYPNLKPVSADTFYHNRYPFNVSTCGFGCIMIRKEFFITC